MDFFSYDDYKQLILATIAQMAKGGRGQFKKLAFALQIHSTLTSHIFKGNNHLTIDQAYGTCEYFAFNELQTDYFLTLVSRDRAGKPALKKYYNNKIKELRQRSQEISERLPKETLLSESDRARFYSQWYYSAIRLLSAIPEYQSIEALSNYFSLPKKKVAEVVHFLVEAGLCLEENGKITYGPSRTHIEASSPLVSRHHANWRLKVIESYEELTEDELAFTTPVIIEKKHAQKIREILLSAIEKTDAQFEVSGCEALYCLNIDWVRVKG